MASWGWGRGVVWVGGWGVDVGGALVGWLVGVGWVFGGLGVGCRGWGVSLWVLGGCGCWGGGVVVCGLSVHDRWLPPLGGSVRSSGATYFTDRPGELMRKTKSSVVGLMSASCSRPWWPPRVTPALQQANAHSRVAGAGYHEARQRPQNARTRQRQDDSMTSKAAATHGELRRMLRS